MIVVTSSLIGLLLAAPSAQLAKVASGTAKEKATVIADAGLRDAITWLTVHDADVSTWIPQPTSAGGVPLRAWVNGMVAPTWAGTTFAVQSPSTYNPVAPTSGGKVVTISYSSGTAYWTLTTLRNGFFTAWSSTNATNHNFTRFGDRTMGRGQYAYIITPRGNGMYRIDVEGQAQDASSAGSGRTISTFITAFVEKPAPTGAVIGASTFSNPNGGGYYTSAAKTTAIATPLLKNTYSGPQPVASTGIDEDATGNDIAGGAIQTSSMKFEGTISPASGSAGRLAGNPAIAGGANSGASASPTADQWAKIDDIIDAASTSSNAQRLTYPSTFSSNGSTTNQGVLYIKIPAGTTVTGPLVTLNGSNGFSGIVIIDAEPNVVFGSSELYLKNGTTDISGAFIFRQKGDIILTSSNTLTVANKNGGPTGPSVTYSSSAVADALNLLQSSTIKIASYVVN